MSEIRLTGADLFDVEVPADLPGAALAMFRRWRVVVLQTDAGVTGYSFVGPPGVEAGQVAEFLEGRDLSDVRALVEDGLWAGVEHAVWDVLGKVAGLPVHRLLGSGQTSLRVYLTTVWQGATDQSDVGFDELAAAAVRTRDAGFRGMKLRAQRPDPMEHVTSMKIIREAVGDDFAVMFDKTAAMGGLWDFETALAVARGLAEHGATWLEEPFDRGDYDSPARLAAAVELPITGGEGYQSLEPFRECLVRGGPDIVQPDVVNCGGILQTVRVAALSRAFGRPCVPHGHMSLSLAGWLQAAAAIGSPWQELVYIVPPYLPADLLRPAEALLVHGPVYEFSEGHIRVPQAPGLGLPVDPDALQRFRV